MSGYVAEILHQQKMSQLSANYDPPFGKRKTEQPNAKAGTPVAQFFELLKRDFNHLNNHDYEKYRKVVITIEPFLGLGLDDDAVLLRLIYVMDCPDQSARRRGLCAHILRCIQEASDDSGAAVICFSNPVELTNNYATPEDVLTRFRAGPVEMKYLRDQMTQSRQNYRFAQAGYKNLNLDEDGMTYFCDKFSTYIYQPQTFNKNLKTEVIEPRLLTSE